MHLIKFILSTFSDNLKIKQDNGKSIENSVMYLNYLKVHKQEAFTAR